MAKLPFAEAFEILQERDAFFEKVGEEKFSKNIIYAQAALIFAFSFIYGLIMGSYNSALQAMVTGTKLCALIFITLAICFPSFYIVQLILGSKVKIKQLLVIMLSGFVMCTTAMLAFAPIVLFFQLSGDNYNFLQLLHVGIFVICGFFGMKAVVDALKSVFEQAGVYPKIGITAFKMWVLIFAFVGMQLAWNLRPFIGYKDMPFQMFREHTQGNIYTTMLQAFGNMVGGTDSPPSNSDNQ